MRQNGVLYKCNFEIAEMARSQRLHHFEAHAAEDFARRSHHPAVLPGAETNRMGTVDETGKLVSRLIL